jgi:hypothetical protein
MNKSEITLIKKIALFLFGLMNIIPSEINIYEHIVDFIEKDLQSTNTFYLAIVLGIWLFRILIVIGTLYEAYDIYRYAKRHKLI